MKTRRILVLALILLMVSGAVFAQSSVKGMNASGITGIIVAPSARIGWEKSDFGLDFTYSMLMKENLSHIPAVTVSLFRKGEIAFAYDFEDTGTDSDFSNLLLGGKFQLYKEGGTALAVGADFEWTVGDAVKNNDDSWKKSMDVYVVATYSGDFFKMPAVTSMMFGWQALLEGEVSSNFNYSMGFELGLFPEVLKNYVYWISDFSNYSYAVHNLRIDTNRGIFNTGIRIDPIKHNKFKLVVNILGTDLLDEDARGFMVNATFGLGF